jgi:hypothetical protein
MIFYKSQKLVVANLWYKGPERMEYLEWSLLTNGEESAVSGIISVGCLWIGSGAV